MQHSSYIGKVGPISPSILHHGHWRCPHVPHHLWARCWPTHGALLCTCSRTRSHPGTVCFCAVPAPSLGKFTVLIPAALGSSRLEKRPQAGHQGHTLHQYDLCLDSNTLRTVCLPALNIKRFQTTTNSSHTWCLHTWHKQWSVYRRCMNNTYSCRSPPRLDTQLQMCSGQPFPA